MSRRTIPLALSLALAACAVSPLGRQQIKLYPDDEVAQLGAAAFQEMKKQLPIAHDPGEERYVQCVTNALARALRADNAPKTWEVEIFRDDSANAFALPGGKIGVHTGMFKVAQNQGQLAAVLGHEISHVIAAHTNERLSTAAVAQTGLSAMQTMMGGADTPAGQQLMAALGLGAQVGVLLPFGRAQESEADVLGLQLMAQAGFDPRQSVELWKRMQQASQGNKPPEFLSTHPAESTRIQTLEVNMPEAMQRYEAATRSGQRPSCSS